MQTQPGTGDASAVEVGPGVLWLRMPLTGSLKWINIWHIAEAEGSAVVDTGLYSPQTVDAWQALLPTMRSGGVKRVIATHMHPDHCGMAGWIAKETGAQLWMSRLEYLTCRLMAADTGHPAPPEGIHFCQAAGWDSEAIGRYKAQFGSFGKMIYPMPAAYRRIQDGDVLALGAHEWRVVIGSGHSPEHACLYCPGLKLFISGDQVLPKISSNVSVWPTEPDADPLGDWLTSLARIKEHVPNDVLVLPAHNAPFRGLHARVDHLINGHRLNLSRLEDALATPHRAIDVFDRLFSRPITPDVLSMATGEAIAHLNHLSRTGRVVRSSDSAGVWWWRQAPQN